MRRPLNLRADSNRPAHSTSVWRRDLHQSKTVDLHWLRAAIDNVIDDTEGDRP